MKIRTIQKILAGKHASWCNSITDEAVKKIAQENTIITGGSIVSLLTNQPISDFDCYFRTPEAAFAIAKYYVAKLLENPPPAFKGDPAHKVEIYPLLEPAIEVGQQGKRIGQGFVPGPLPARVRIVVKSAGIAGENKQDNYQYFEGTNPAEQATLTDAYINNAVGERAEGQITDDTEPNDDVPLSSEDEEFNVQQNAGPGYVENASEADDIPAVALDEPAPKTKQEKQEAQKRGKYRVLFVTSNAITLSDQMQLIIRFQGEAADIHRNFDYLHCTSYWTSWEKKVVCSAETLLCIMNKELTYVGSLYPLCSIIRLRKFLARGYTINAGQIIKILWQVNQLDLSDPNVLEDQLVGVDSAYFTQVISALREKLSKETPPEGCRVEVDGTYLMTLIDKVF